MSNLTYGQILYSRRKKKVVEKGICARCGFYPIMENATICSHCSETQKKRLKTMVMERKMLRLCIRCGGEDARTLAGKTRCTKCWLKENAKRKKKKE